MRPTLTYLDDDQSAVILGNDTVVIYGGGVEVSVEFNWSKTDSQGISVSGYGTAVNRLAEISYAKMLYLEKGSIIV